MNGSIQPKNGKLYAVLSYRGENGKFKYKWVNTGLPVRGNKKKAEAMIPVFIERFAYLEENKEENKKDTNKIMFVDYILDWLERKKNKVQQSTWEGYEIYAKCHIIPYFEPLQLEICDVTPKHIVDYFESRLVCGRRDHKPGGLGHEAIKKHKTVLNMVFDDALIAELINRNPVEHVPLPKKDDMETRERVFLNVEEANAMLEAFRGHELQALVYTTLYYGLRRSEVLGLKWDAVDFECETLKIQHTVVKNRSVVAKDTTKSAASRRTFPLLPEVKELLLRLKAQQQDNRLLFGSEYEESAYIFVWPDGHLYRPDYITRSFKKVLAYHGLPDMRFHDIRHSTASILYDAGWELKDIQEWLGHSDIETTGNIYTHISKIRKEKKGMELAGTFRL